MSKLDLEKEKHLKELGARLRVLRIAKGYANHETFANMHGFGRSQYNRYERGVTEPGYYTLQRIIQALGMTKQEFFSEGFEEE